MLGKKSTMRTVRQEIHKLSPSALRVTEFVQGRTSRWGIAWSFAASSRVVERKRLHSQLEVPLITK